jgi:hypothetical protein
MEDQTGPATVGSMQATPAESRPESVRPQVRQSFIALKSGEIYTVARYRIDDGSLSYELPWGEKGSIDLPEVDWQATAQLNAGVPAASVSVMQQQR